MTIDIKIRTQEIINTSLEEQKKKNPQTTELYTVKGERVSLPVINLNLDLLMLNPDNHRLTAQFGEKDNYKELNSNPRSNETQGVLSKLLSETDEFGRLKGQLEQLGQRDPGLVTRDGLLVNGNTRYVALKQLRDSGKNNKGMDVAVLPPEISDSDIISIEMELQMLKLVEQKYTFTNELLFLQNFREMGKSDNQIILSMGWRKGKPGQRKVEQHFRILDIIQEVRQIKKVPYYHFDTKKTHLFDLDGDLQILKEEADMESYHKLKYLRLLAMFWPISKDQVRAISSDHSKHGSLIDDLYNNFSDESDEKNYLKKYLMSTDADNENLALISDDVDSGIDTRKLLEDYLLQEDILDTNGKVNIDQEGVFAKIISNVSEATNSIIRQQVRKSKGQELSITMRAIREDIAQINEIIAERIDLDTFKEGDFLYELNKAKKELENLNHKYNKIKKSN
jgi:hypothetical protein